MTRPRLLDLFCGAGGCARGYVEAGFDVVGVDHRPMPRYLLSGASAFVQGDALEYVAQHGHKFDVIHASPPCQAYSSTRSIHKRDDLPHLLPRTRELLQASGKLWVIENVPGAPMHDPAIVCGLMLGLRVKRHRLFESPILLFGTGCPRGHKDSFLTVTGHSGYAVSRDRRWVSVHGGGAPARPDNRRRADSKTAALAMGIDWMTRDELSQAIPPKYTKYVGKQLLQAIRGGDQS